MTIPLEARPILAEADIRRALSNAQLVEQHAATRTKIRNSTGEAKGIHTANFLALASEIGARITNSRPNVPAILSSVVNLYVY